MHKTNKPVRLFFLHGWACDGQIWHAWLSAIDKDITYSIFDRGYLKSGQKDISLDKESHNIVITHSFGTHFLPAESFQYIDQLVLISGFRYFYEESLDNQLISKTIWLMKHRLSIDPVGLLQDFYLKCGLAKVQLPEVSKLNKQLLYNDLVLLETHKLNLDVLKAIPNISFLHANKDQVVSCDHSKLMHQLLPNSKLFLHQTAEHALPITDARWCMETINTISDQKLFKQNSDRSHSSYWSIAKNFNRAWQTYEKTASAQAFAAQRLAARIGQQNKSLPDGSVLEVGCGTGFLSKHLHDIFPQRTMHFLDPAEDMLNVCRNNFLGSVNREFIHNTIEEHLSVHENVQKQYALIVSSFAFHWLFDLKTVLEQLLKRLKEKGQLFFAFPVAGSFHQWKSACNRLNIPFTANQLPSAEDIKLIGANYAFTLDCEQYECDETFDSSLQFFQYLKTIGANTKKVTPANSLKLADFKSLLYSWNGESVDALGKHPEKIICTYKILEGSITKR